jgi:hypothetical protein
LFLLDVLKFDFRDDDKTMFKGVERPCDLIFYLQDIQKSDLDEDAEVILQVSEWPWELIIYLLDVLKNFGDVDEAMFEGVERPCEIFFCILGI